MTEPDTLPAPALPDYDAWEAEADRGARDAHTDASRALGERLSPQEVVDQGPAYWSGYNAHWVTLLNVGLVVR